MLLELELSRVIETYNQSKEPVKLFLVVYEMKAIELLKQYQQFVMDLQRRGNIEIEVLNIKEICNRYCVKWENR